MIKGRKRFEELGPKWLLRFDGIVDLLDGYDRVVVCGSCLLSSVTNTSVLCVSEHFVLCVPTWYSITSVFLVGLCVGSRQVYVTC